MALTLLCRRRQAPKRIGLTALYLSAQLTLELALS